jgi:hypothetical protein
MLVAGGGTPYPLRLPSRYEPEYMAPWGDIAWGLTVADSVTKVSHEVMMERLREADVVLVADWHSLPHVQWLLGELLSEASDYDRRPTAVALEALPASLTSLARRMNDEQPWPQRSAWLSTEIERAWSWPVSGYATWGSKLARVAPAVLPAGLNEASALHCEGMDDPLRRPLLLDVDAAPADDLRWLKEVNENAVRAISGYLRWPGGRRVWGLFGAAHILGRDTGLKMQLERAGWKVCVVVSHDVAIELVLEARGWAGRADCIELAPGVLRYGPLSCEALAEYLRVSTAIER